MSVTPRYHALRLNELVLHLRLGCEESERARPQEVRVSIEIRFSSPPAATESDRLTDTVCYARLSEALRAHCEAREYRLIERVGLDAYRVAREIAGPETALALSVHKIKPPVERLLGGAVYRCGDFAP
jgi:dihydroneopterin aldolase